MRRSLVIALVLAVACASKGPTPVQLSDQDVIPYRLITKKDFKSLTSNSIWGNVAHGAEICTSILPAEDFQSSGVFRAVMKQECSFWNRTHRLKQAGGLVLGAVTGVYVLPRKQPDWYILQHEQIHFAIMQLAASKLSKRAAALSPAERTPERVHHILRLTQEATQSQHRKFDSHTSGVYDPDYLESWVRVLERQLNTHCDGRCPVRIAE